MNSKDVNMRQIAQKLNISTATVSRALNNPEKVKTSTLERVLKAVEEMNYVPRQQLPASSNVIAYMMGFTDNAFYNNFYSHITNLAKERDMYVLSCATNGNPEIESTMFEYFKRMNCSGIILSGLFKMNNIVSSVPVVLLSSPQNTQGNIYTVHSDSDCSIKMLVDYLVKLNHKRIGFINGDDKTYASIERFSAFKKYMKIMDLDFSDDDVYYGNFTLKSGIDAFDYFFSRPKLPTAIIAANDDMAKGFILRANSLGIKIPDDISICGIDAVDNDVFQPKITSIKQDVNAIAKQTFSIILDGKPAQSPVDFVIPVSFSPGQTCYRI